MQLQRCWSIGGGVSQATVKAGNDMSNRVCDERRIVVRGGRRASCRRAFGRRGKGHGAVIEM